MVLALDQLQDTLGDRYQLEDELGSGGQGAVFRAHDRRLSRTVAIKFLRPEIAPLIGPDRFQREIAIAASLTHPNIVPLLDSGGAPPHLYYTMPLVQGESLRARLRREQQLPVEDALRIVGDVAAALDYAHARGYVHRDIKPENILLTGERAIVLDFGIARAIEVAGDDSITSGNLVIGTPMYMSPEQGSGHKQLDGRTDIYSLACVLYEMLAGAPPFTGATPQAVIARHLMDPPPSLSIVRRSVSPALEEVIDKALSKAPADRYATAAEMMHALADAKRHPGGRARTLRRARRGALVLVPAAIALVGGLVFSRAPALNPNRVVVFPLGESPPEATSEGTGIQVALMIGSALEYTEPLEWVDGLPLLDTRLRKNAGLLTSADARRIAQGARAKWYLDGSVVRQRDSVTVIVRLNDASGDSVISRRSATRPAPQAAQAGLAAVNQLLPGLLSPGQRIDLSALENRHPAAVASWLQGERAYRSFNFEEALEFEKRAVADDSALAVAALRGAQAASWLNDVPQAEALAQVALRGVDLLPSRMTNFARGFHAYLTGQADSAVQWLTRAVQQSPDWPEAHMALGEVYYHLLPSVSGPHDSLAHAEFLLAAADTGFSPPRFHLAEHALRHDTPANAARMVNDFLLRADDTQRRAQLLPMLACVREGRKAVQWRAVAAAQPLEALQAAEMLAVGGRFPGCAEDGLREVFDNRNVPLGHRWGAFLGLQGLLAAEGRITELRALIESAVGSGLGLANQLYLLDALAGVKVEREAEQVAKELTKKLNKDTYPFSLWLLGAWRARHGDRSGTAVMEAALRERAKADKSPRYVHMADVVGARLLLLNGDTAAAINGLRRAIAFGRREALDWDVGESLAPDRLLLADLLLAQGQSSDALSVATVFDHPAPAVFLPFLPASLRLREEAALALKNKGDAEQFHKRLVALEGDARSVSLSPPTEGERP
jgi:tetratricopeptide (TPR) repeat protein